MTNRSLKQRAVYGQGSAGIVAIVTAPVRRLLAAHARRRAIAGLEGWQRTELLHRLLEHPAYMVRELSLLLKVVTCMALLQPGPVRERTAYDTTEESAAPRVPVVEAARPTMIEGLDVLPANIDLTGAELELGTVLGDHFDEPVLLIKAAWGGHSLAKLFRPPSAGMPSEEALDVVLATNMISVGVDINCAVIGFTSKAPRANLAKPVPGSQFPPR